jgi:outer membrane protein assembly factor BamB
MTIARDSNHSTGRDALVSVDRDALKDCCCRPCRDTRRVVTDGEHAYVVRRRDASNHWSVQRRTGDAGELVWEYSPLVDSAHVSWFGLAFHEGQLVAMSFDDPIFSRGQLAWLTTAGGETWLEDWRHDGGDVFLPFGVGVGWGQGVNLGTRTAVVFGRVRLGSKFFGGTTVHALSSGARLTEVGYPSPTPFLFETVTAINAWLSDGDGINWYSTSVAQSTFKAVVREGLSPTDSWAVSPIAGLVSCLDLALHAGVIYAACSRDLISGPQSFVAAIDAVTGAVLWVSPLQTDRSYLAIDADDDRVYLAGLGTADGDGVRAIAWAMDHTGAELWQMRVPAGSPLLSNVGHDIAAGSGRVFLASSCGNGFGRSLWRLNPATGAVVWSV